MEQELAYFKKLYQEKRTFELLEWLYLAITIVTVFVAGIVALLNQSIGVGLLIIPLVSFIALITNFVCWSVMDAIIQRFIKPEKPTKKK